MRTIQVLHIQSLHTRKLEENFGTLPVMASITKHEAVQNGKEDGTKREGNRYQRSSIRHLTTLCISQYPTPSLYHNFCYHRQLRDPVRDPVRDRVYRT